jgi:hypothetical protein
MNWLTKWLCGNTQTRRTPARKRRTFRPSFEGLEDRLVPTVTFHGGAVLPHVEVQGLYIGNQWSSNSTLASQTGYLEGFLNSIVHSSYMDELTNAGYGVGRGSFTAGKISLASLASGSTLDDSTIRSWLSRYVSGKVLQPADANTLYVCFVEPNVLVTMSGSNSHSNFLGYHGAFSGPGGTAIRYAVIAYPGGPTSNASVSFLTAQYQLTEVASHEIAEAATNPDVNFRTMGWYDDAKNGEVGDITNQQTMYVNGYAMQRIADKNDFAMTPAQATSDRVVNFVLQTNGNFVEITSSGSTALAGSIAAISEQGIDNQGHAMVDVVDTSGRSWEFHDTGNSGSWTYLGANIKSAKAGQGVSYVLFTNGTLQEYNDASRVFTTIYTGVSQISAGTDVQGANAVDALLGSSAYEHSDDSGWHFIATAVQSISAGRQGISDYVTTGGVAHWHSESGNGDVALASGVSQVAAGTDQNGAYIIDLLYSSGSLQEYRTGSGWSTLASSGVKSLGKGRLDAVDVIFSTGLDWEHTLNGWRSLGSNALTAV